MSRLASRTRPSTQVSTWLTPRGGVNILDYSPFLWLDASDTATITSVGGAVSQWNDKSGNSRNVSQGTAAARPTTGSTTVNGLNSLTFDGGDYLQISATGFPTTASRAMFTVSKLTANLSSASYFHIAAYGNAGLTSNSCWALTNYFDGSALKGRVHIWGNNSSPFTSQSISPSASTFQLTAIYDSATTTIYGNGTTGQSLNLALTTAVDGNFLIGTRTYSPAEYWTGQICEVIMLNYAPTTDQRQTIENYLMTKWGII